MQKHGQLYLYLRWGNPSVIAGASSRDNLINLPNFVRYATAAGESEIFPADELLRAIFSHSRM